MHPLLRASAALAAVAVALVLLRACPAGAPSSGDSGEAPALPSDARFAPRNDRTARDAVPRARATAPSSRRFDDCGDCDDDVAETAVATRDPTTARMPSRAVVPECATTLAPSGGVRAWATVARASRGLATERGAVPGRIAVAASSALEIAETFAVTVEPDGAVRCPPTLRLSAGHDTALLPFTGRSRGPAVVVLTPSSGGAPIRVPVVLLDAAEFPDPELRVVVTRADASAPGGVSATDEQVRGLRGSVVANVRVVRSCFRDFDRLGTDVAISTDDRDGVLRPLPALVSIAPGAVESESIRIATTDRAGRAVLRFRAGSSEAVLVVDSIAATWRAPEEIAVAAGSEIEVPIDVDPRAWAAPEIDASCDTNVAAVSVPSAGAGAAYPTRVVLRVRGFVPGETTMRLRADGRPDLSVRVRVRRAEVADAVR